MLSQPNPLDQLKSKIIRSFEIGFDLERENDGEKDRRWAGLGSAASGGLELTMERNEEDEDRLRGERSNGRNGEGGEKKNILIRTQIK